MPVRICMVIACRMTVLTITVDSVIRGHYNMDSLSSDRRHFQQRVQLPMVRKLYNLFFKRVYLSVPLRIIESLDNRGSDNRGSTVFNEVS